MERDSVADKKLSHWLTAMKTTQVHPKMTSTFFNETEPHDHVLQLQVLAPPCGCVFLVPISPVSKSIFMERFCWVRSSTSCCDGLYFMYYSQQRCNNLHISNNVSHNQSGSN